MCVIRKRTCIAFKKFILFFPFTTRSSQSAITLVVYENLLSVLKAQSPSLKP